MNQITIATFISKNEKFNRNFYDLYKTLTNYFRVECIVFCEKKIEEIDTSIKQVLTPKMTKYKRIEKLIEISENDDILCVDNDIKINKENIVKFINEVLSKDYAIGWGKIKSKNIKGVMSHLIKIDKNLSHDFIRPLLWKMNIGISVPGQVFIINKKYYKGKFQNIDTIYDDLTLGIIAKSNNMPVYFNKMILGYETPKTDFKNLIKQRKRWAKGLAESIYNNRKSEELKYVKIHRFMYHYLWMVYYLIIILLSVINFRIGIFIFLLTGILLAKFKIRDIV